MTGSEFCLCFFVSNMQNNLFYGFVIELNGPFIK